ncbi:MAG: hypothetical protein M3M85_03635 [bacterium]|nr:hypothetical protein [bacterium]
MNLDGKQPLMTATELGIKPKQAQRMRRLFEVARGFVKEIDSHIEVVEQGAIKLPTFNWIDDDGRLVPELSSVGYGITGEQEEISDEEFQRFLAGEFRIKLEKLFRDRMIAFKDRLDNPPFKGQEGVEFFGQTQRELMEAMERFVERQPELATIFNLKYDENALKKNPTATKPPVWKALQDNIERLEAEKYKESAHTPDQDTKTLKAAAHNFFSGVGHNVFRIEYLVDGYDLANEKAHPSYAKDCQELYSIIEKMRQIIERHGFVVSLPTESPYRIGTILEEAEVARLKNEGIVAYRSPDNFRNFPDIRKIVQARIKEDSINDRAIVDLNIIPMYIVSEKFNLDPNVVLSGRFEWMD